MKPTVLWMPHPAHFIGAYECGFRLATYVNGYIISTVGEYAIYGESPTKEQTKILKKIYGLKKYSALGGDLDSFYETMVFDATENDDDESACCPYKITNTGEPVETYHYKTNKEATDNHMKLVEQYRFEK